MCSDYQNDPSFGPSGDNVREYGLSHLWGDSHDIKSVNSRFKKVLSNYNMLSKHFNRSSRLPI